MTRTRYGDIREMGTHRVLMCNAEDASISVDAGRVEMVIEHLSVISPDAAFDVLATRGNDRARVKMARVLGAIAITATALAAGGYLAISAKEAGLLGLGISGAGQLKGRIERSVLVFDRSKLLTGRIDIAPGACLERVVFSGLIPRNKLGPRDYRLRLNNQDPLASSRRRPSVVQLTSVGRWFSCPSDGR